ncbi:2-phosphosulfolactate phosphatase [Cellulomonas alba]|uniref:Probable 2-phosphosulfolactate phosphatase n=1 Tax=Cellulomonas alba TaxID=3053467 RepID=A0ABT7SBQ5_9CELL|nr:2-phosphosulfolactate phosphatase [Cellulomonas alba]MDM7853610.1 2-phosphosulfolactate phosphatase [Cellulomonas alba]
MPSSRVDVAWWQDEPDLAGADVLVVVDVLSFTTTLAVAADRGIEVVPCDLDGREAAVLAERHHARLASHRRTAGPGEVSLSPASVRTAADVRRLVLPSPNGAAVSAELAASGRVVIGAALYNAHAVGRWIRARHPGARTLVVACGERRDDGTIRRAEEDLWGAGAVVDALVDGGARPSEAAARARDVWDGVADRAQASLLPCQSGRELASAGFTSDVVIAAEVDRGDAAAVLHDGVYVPVRP